MSSNWRDHQLFQFLSIWCSRDLPCHLIPTTFDRGIDTCTYASPVVPGVYLIASVTETHPSSGCGLTPEVTWQLLTVGSTWRNNQRLYISLKFLNETNISSSVKQSFSALMCLFFYDVSSNYHISTKLQLKCKVTYSDVCCIITGFYSDLTEPQNKL